MDERDPTEGLSDDERAAVERTERGIEWFHRAQGSLLEFHHAVGQAMDEFGEVAEHLDGEHDDLAAAIREEILPAGVTADGKWTYEVVEEFEEGLLAEAEDVADGAFEDLVDSERYAIERRGRE
ncbi:MAG: hypothetical protein ABEJ28_01065 [Salinigranum sp.]